MSSDINRIPYMFHSEPTSRKHPNSSGLEHYNSKVESKFNIQQQKYNIHGDQHTDSSHGRLENKHDLKDKEADILPFSRLGKPHGSQSTICSTCCGYLSAYDVI
jgi:hypothetical protein